MGLDTIAQHLNQRVYVVAAPVADIVIAGPVFFECFRIVDVLTINGVWIKIIIHVYTVYIIIINHI